MVQVSKRLVVRKEVPLDNSKDLVNSLDLALAEYHCNQKKNEKSTQKKNRKGRNPIWLIFFVFVNGLQNTKNNKKKF